jgi:hypothetical protein
LRQIQYAVTQGCVGLRNAPVCKSAICLGGMASLD